MAAQLGYEPPGDPPEHGTNARRVKWGCSCADCKRAHAVYEYDRRKRKTRHDPWRQMLVLGLPVRIAGRRVPAGQLLLPLDLPTTTPAVLLAA